MVKRILDIIKYATDGNKAQFAEKLGWKGQYLQNILKGVIGLTPITTILKAFPEINARWLILGDGSMLDETLFMRRQLSVLSDELQTISDTVRTLSKENVQQTCTEETDGLQKTD